MFDSELVCCKKSIAKPHVYNDFEIEILKLIKTGILDAKEDNIKLKNEIKELQNKIVELINVVKDVRPPLDSYVVDNL